VNEMPLGQVTGVLGRHAWWIQRRPEAATDSTRIKQSVFRRVALRLTSRVGGQCAVARKASRN